MNLDTNIDNYDLDDMVRLFKISNNLSNENISRINATMNTLNSSFSINEVEPDVYFFIQKIIFNIFFSS